MDEELTQAAKREALLQDANRRNSHLMLSLQECEAENATLTEQVKRLTAERDWLARHSTQHLGFYSGGGYDHNFVYGDETTAARLRAAIEATQEVSDDE